MSSVLPASLSSRPSTGAADRSWWIAIVGFAAMYLPVYWWAANTIWQSDDHAHGALILAVMVWLFWGLRHEIAATPTEPALGWGISTLAVGTIVYIAGRIFSISILELASQPFVVAGVLLLMRGKQALRVAWFPVFYFIFMVPLPGFFVDAITNPLKQWISVIVVELLYGLGYSISRNGVILTIGQYQMLVADACSGLHSMYSLSALGTLFMYIMKRKSLAHNAIMLASILPIAFVANMVRVIALVLITYHFGDEAGQGFLHGAAGMVLMLVALLFFFFLDAVLARVFPSEPGPPRDPGRPAAAAA